MRMPLTCTLRLSGVAANSPPHTQVGGSCRQKSGLAMQLRQSAAVGLAGRPNAGKTSYISRMYLSMWAAMPSAAAHASLDVRTTVAVVSTTVGSRQLTSAAVSASHATWPAPILVDMMVIL